MDLRIANQVVQQISFDYAITLRTDDGSQIRIETEFSIQDMEGRSIAIDPSSAGDSCTDVLSLLHETITDAAADEGTGSLSLTFGNGSLARADAHDSYEAWTFDGPRGFKCVAPPVEDSAGGYLTTTQRVCHDTDLGPNYTMGPDGLIETRWGMVDSNSECLHESLERLVRGDIGSLSEILSADRAAIREAAGVLGEPLIVTRTAAVSVLHGLLDGAISPELTQAWASFVRRGYVAEPDGGPIRPINIDYEQAYEDDIAETVSRLDEIGDLVDGEVSSNEVLALLQLLGEPWPLLGRRGDHSIPGGTRNAADTQLSGPLVVIRSRSIILKETP